MKDALQKAIERMRSQPPLPEKDYFSVTMLGKPEGGIEIAVFSGFAGFTETKPRREIREAAEINVEPMREAYAKIGEPCVVVNDSTDMAIYLTIGGHGLIEETIAKKFLPTFLEKKVCITSYSKGFLFEQSLPKKQTVHAPSPKVRMNVIERDNYRCKICGRSPNEDVHVVLEAHHIIPWGEGGITEEDNLITLCHTCHVGLEPHKKTMLFDFLGIDHLQDSLRKSTEYNDGMKRYIDNFDRKSRIKTLRK